jgi:hypothetical protein
MYVLTFRFLNNYEPLQVANEKRIRIKYFIMKKIIWTSPQYDIQRNWI